MPSTFYNLFYQLGRSVAMHPLAHLMPLSNVIAIPAFSAAAGMSALVAAYTPGESTFIGAFCDNDDFPDWARRIARYNREDFRKNTPGVKKQFGDIASELADDGAGRVLANYRHALDVWIAGGKQGPEPFSCQQDYGSCVDASAAEHMTAMLGWRAAQPSFNEKYELPAAWYWYADRGYCGDGWDGSGIAAVALRRGIAFRKKYDIGGKSVDFTDDDKNEQIVARQWCRTGIPEWMYQETQTNHPLEDGCITEFNGSVADVRAVMAAGGIIQTGGTYTSGGSKPFTIGRVGGHMQSFMGADDSDEYRKFCKDTLGVTPRTNDFPVIASQTWGRGWSGECADKYWPGWWGPKPQGAWVWWASDMIKYFRGDMFAWLPRFKGIAAGPTPPPPPPPPPGPLPTDQLYFTGTVEAMLGDKSLGKFLLVPKPEL